MPQSHTTTRPTVRHRIDTPRDYDVIFHNDDFTTMDFVTMVITTIFHKPELEAAYLTQQIHREGKASVGTYTYDIAQTKSQRVIRMAREAGFPLQVSVEPVDNLPF